VELSYFLEHQAAIVAEMVAHLAVEEVPVEAILEILTEMAEEAELELSGGQIEHTQTQTQEMYKWHTLQR